MRKTHVVERKDKRVWNVIHHGSERDCDRLLDLVRRHYPDKEFRMMTIEESDEERTKPTWLESDADHIPNGSRVMLTRSPYEIHASAGVAHKAFQIKDDAHEDKYRYGVIRSRNPITGDYMVEIEGTGSEYIWQVAIDREDLVYPVHENVVPLNARRRGDR